ncbi:MAG: TonB-dependent receptor [Rhodospirillales bacterium]|nr:TonB-dependent receptor [Rhodospirillales bacterium]
MFWSGTALAQSTGASATVNAGTVSATGTTATTAASPTSTVLTKKKRQHATQAVTTVTLQDMNLFSPQAGGLQSLTAAPGVQVSGYAAQSGAARTTLSVRGVKVGWNSVPGDLETNGLTAELDGVPLNSLIQATGWHSTEVPLGPLLQGTNLIYGPGNPRERWYDSLGGTVNFIPVQPSPVAGVTISGSFGSFNSQSDSFVGQTGEHDGWSAVLGYAHASYDTFRQGSFNWPSYANQVFAKIRKRYASGEASLGFFYQHSDEFRPNMIPVTPVAGLTTLGANAVAPLYSQQTSGFYSDLPREVWFKRNQIRNFIVYGKLVQDLGPGFTLHDTMWYRHGEVIHYRVNNGYPPLNPTGTEYYYPHSDTFGNKLHVDVTLPYHNVLSVGAYAITSHTVDNLDLYNVLLETSRANPNYIQYNTYDNTFVAAFAQDRLTLFHRLHIVPGIELVNYSTSFYNNNASAAASFGGGLVAGTNYNTNPDTSKTFQRLEPSIGVSLDVLPWLTAYGNTAITYQNPTAGNFNNAQTDLPSLRPVRSQDWEIGLRSRKRNVLVFSRTFLDVNYFHDFISDQTIPISLASNPAVTTFGYGSATLQGVNLEMDCDIGFPWRLFANGEILDAHWNRFVSTTTNLTYAGLPVSNSPVFTGNIGVRYRHFLGRTLMSAALYDQYVGRRYLFSNQIGAPTKLPIGAYNLLNLVISARIPIHSAYAAVPRMVKLTFTATNLLGRRYNSTAYVSAGGYFNGVASAGTVLANPGQPRAFYGSVTVGF